MPLEAHIKEHAAWFKRFDALWTPTILVMDASGIERSRIEGYLPKDWFRARLELGLARVAFMHKEWENAKRIYADVAEDYADTAVAPEAIYWRAVCQYKATNDHKVLGEAPNELGAKYPDSEWALKALPWAH